MFNTILSQYSDNNFYMCPNLLKLMQSLELINVVTDFVLLTNNDCLFPPNRKDTAYPILMDYEGYTLPRGDKTECDKEYIFDPNAVYKMRGKKMKAFNHNIHVFSNKYHNVEYKKGKYEDILDIFDNYIVHEEHQKFNRKWFVAAKMLNYKVLYLDGVPIGFNMWDESKQYIHYIMTYAIPMDMYSNDYIQWLFYRDMSYTRYNKNNLYVNAGGNFDNPDVEEEQMKKNPIEVRTRYSWNYE